MSVFATRKVLAKIVEIAKLGKLAKNSTTRRFVMIGTPLIWNTPLVRSSMVKGKLCLKINSSVPAAQN